MNFSSAALIRNEVGDILIVKPTYRDEWLLPGGAIKNGESPIEACERECREELNIEVQAGELLCGEHRKSNSVSVRSKRFIFDCGTLNSDVTIQLPPEDLEAFKFVRFDKTLGLVDSGTAKRLIFISLGSGVYFES